MSKRDDLIPVIKSVKCARCGRVHSADAETFATVFGNVTVGARGGLVGDNLDGECRVFRAVAYCHPECLAAVLYIPMALKRGSDPAFPPFFEGPNIDRAGWPEDKGQFKREPTLGDYPFHETPVVTCQGSNIPIVVDALDGMDDCTPPKRDHSPQGGDTLPPRVWPALGLPRALEPGRAYTVKKQDLRKPHEPPPTSVGVESVKT
jgi:hypothetical protein